MKTFTFLIILLLPVFSTQAAVRTVSNDPTRPAQFNNFDAAQTASVNNDTIYIYGSPFQYPAITIRKKLVIVGAGYSPNNQFGQPTNISSISLFRDASADNATGTVITGVLTSTINLSGTQLATNITLFRNRITYVSIGLSSGWVIYNNIVTGSISSSANSSTDQSATNVIIANNILSSVTTFNSNTVIIDHNIFLSSNNIFRLFNVIISNNIFTRSSGNIFSQSSVCTYSNNLSNQSTIGAASEYTPTNTFLATYIPNSSSNSGGGNQVGINPLFVNVTNFDTYNNTFNYRLQDASPGNNAGTDGTDLGIYGGTYPFPSGGNPGSGYDTAPSPPIPQVISVNIQNATIQPNGTLNVQVQGKVNN